MAIKPIANLIIRPERLGDLAIATPVFRAFKETWPEIPVHVLTDNVYSKAIENDPHIDRIINIRWKSSRRQDRDSFLHIYRQLQSTRYISAAVLFSGCDGWNWTLAAAGVKKVAQLGGTWPGLLLGHKMVFRRNHLHEKHYEQWYLDVARQLGASTADETPRLYITTHDRENFFNRFPDWVNRKPRILIHPFEPGSAPRFSREAFQRLISEIKKKFNVELFITGSAKDAASWPSVASEGISEDFLGKLNLRELMCACEAADLVIAGSTGIIHVAAAVGTNTLGFYCPALGANPALWGPRGSGESICLTPRDSFCKHMQAQSTPCKGDRRCDLSLGIDFQTIIIAIAKLIKHPIKTPRL